MPKSFDIKKIKSRGVDLKKQQHVAPLSRINQPSARPLYNERASYREPQKRKRFSFLTFLIVLLFLLVAAAVASFLLFYDKGPSGRSLKFALAVPNDITAGEDFNLSLSYENLDKVLLDQIEVVIEYPDNYYFNEANIEPINSEKNVWQLAPLGPGESGEIRINGYLIGEINDEKEFRVIFHYQPENFNSDFQEDISKKVKITDSVLEVLAEVPEMIEDGAEVEFKIKYQNQTAESLPNLVLAFDLGDAFQAIETSPQTNGTTWQIENLEVDAEGEILLKGKIDSTLANPFNWLLIVWRNQEDQSDRYLYKKEGKIDIEAPKLNLSLTLNDENQEINWGEVVEYKISLENIGEIALSQPVLKLYFPSGNIDWSKFNNTTNATVDAGGNSLIWLSSNGGWTEGLIELKSGQKIENIVSVSITNEPTDLVNLEPGELVVEAQVAVSFKSQGEQKVFNSEKLSNGIVNQAQLTTEARYYLDSQTMVGAGPLPPVIGQATSYRIYWKMFSGSAGLSSVEIKTALPNYVTWKEDTGEVTFGSNFKFNNSSKELVWEMENLSANSQVMGSFNVEVTPNESQINQLLILTNPTLLVAEEAVSKKVITQTANLLTSDLVNDPQGQGKGRVTVGQ